MYSLHLQWFQPISWYPLHPPLHCPPDIRRILHCDVPLISAPSSIALYPCYPLHSPLHCLHWCCHRSRCNLKGITSRREASNVAGEGTPPYLAGSRCLCGCRAVRRQAWSTGSRSDSFPQVRETQSGGFMTLSRRLFAEILITETKKTKKKRMQT